LPHAPAGDPAFASLYDDSLRWRVLRARWQVAARDDCLAPIAGRLEAYLLLCWQRRAPGAGWLEKKGLPRRALERRLEDELVLHVDPRRLIRSTDWRGYRHSLRPASSVFIWDGEWDLYRGDLRFGSRYRFISDLDDHRHHLASSESFAHYAKYLKAGKPWSSHQQGVLLNSEERILAYLRAYLGFLDGMAAEGFDDARGKDDLGVAVSRDGRLLKINRGLHRLAMAQRLGLPTVPVWVKAVHREWWQRVVGEAKGQLALEKVSAALKHCVPETRPGKRDPAERSEVAFTWPGSRSPEGGD
jgi:hypothetical protein